MIKTVEKLAEIFKNEEFEKSENDFETIQEEINPYRRKINFDAIKDYIQCLDNELIDFGGKLDLDTQAVLQSYSRPEIPLMNLTDSLVKH